jgi:hypothetical protein
MNPHNKDVWDMSLDFWESGPLRELVESEYASIVRDQMKDHPDCSLSEVTAKKLHDLVVCSTFDFIIDAVSYGTPDGKPFTFKNKTLIREEIARLTRLHLEEAFLEPKSAPGSAWSAGSVLSVLGKLFPAADTD